MIKQEKNFRSLSVVQTVRRSEPFSSPPVHQAVWRRHQDQAGRVPASKRRALQRPELRDPRQAAGSRAVQHPAVPFQPPLERGPLELGTLVTDSLSCLSEIASFSRRARSFRVFEGNRGARAPEEVRLHLLRLSSQPPLSFWCSRVAEARSHSIRQKKYNITKYFSDSCGH